MGTQQQERKRLLFFISAFLASFVLNVLGLSRTVEAQEAVPGEYIIKLKNSPTLGRLLRRSTVFSERLGADVQSYVKSTNVALVKRAAIETQESAIQALMRDPLIQYVEPNYVYYPFREPFNKFYYKNQWGLKSRNYPKVDIDAETAWDMTIGSKEILVLVADSGIDYKHPNLVENIWTNPGESGRDSAGKDKSFNGIDDDGNGYIDDVHGSKDKDMDGGLNGDPMDTLGHGTHCAGVIGAYSSNMFSVVGVNWNVKMAAFKMIGREGYATAFGDIQSIDYAIAIKARVINASWGGKGDSILMKDALEKANQAGILLVAAAGNGDEKGWGMNNDFYPSYPSNYALDNVIAVAAVDEQGDLASFSNYGIKTVHLGAPGVNIMSTVPEGELKYMSGTSMATPFVTGVAALVLSSLPKPGLMTPKELREVILSAVRPLRFLSEKTSSKGVLNAPDAIIVGIVRNVAKVFATPKD